MPDQLAFLPERVFTAAAMPGAGYRVEFFQSGTTTPVTVYTTASLLVAHPTVVVSDANGVFPAVFSAGGAIKAVITKPDGSSFYTVDPVLRISTSLSGASEITFNPTVALPFTNVQDAVEAAAASAASGFTPFGLGVTGTNALIANIDATGTASGSYRFDNTTTGTFPTGVTAANTGTVQINRENAGDAVMWLQSGSVDRAFFRRMASSTWGAWQEITTIPPGSAEGDTIYRGASAWLRLAKGTANQVLTMNAGATAPEWKAFASPVKAWGNLQANIGGSGVYNRSGNTVFVTMTSHGMTTGQGVILDFTTGTASDGFYFITVVDANIFTVTDPVSGTTSGNVTRVALLRGGTGISAVGKVSTGIFEFTLGPALPDTNYAVVVSGTSGGGEAAGDMNDWFTSRVVTSSAFRLRCVDTTGALVDPTAFYFSVLG